MDWKAKGKAKRESILHLIPPKWRLSNVPSREKKRNVTGDYIRGSLSRREIEITETSATRIVEQTTKGEWTAEEVTRAFAHRAALAHQLVRPEPNREAQILCSPPLPGQLPA